MTDETIIELGRFKIVFGIIVSAAFVALGIWLFNLNDENYLSRHSANYVHGAGILSVVVFGFLGLGWLWKLFDHRPGLKFSEQGIIDASTGLAGGAIPWSDVIGFDFVQTQRTHFIVIKVSDPDKYLGRGNWLQRRLKEVNARMYGSPVVLTSGTLAVSFDELLETFEHYMKRYCPGVMSNHV